MILASLHASATQDVGRKWIGSFRVTPSFLSDWKAKNKSKKIGVKIPFMVKTLRCDLKNRWNPPVPAFREELLVIHREALPEKGVASFWKKGCRVPTESVFRGSTYFMDGIWKSYPVSQKKKQRIKG